MSFLALIVQINYGKMNRPGEGGNVKKKKKNVDVAETCSRAWIGTSPATATNQSGCLLLRNEKCRQDHRFLGFYLYIGFGGSAKIIFWIIYEIYNYVFCVLSFQNRILFFLFSFFIFSKTENIVHDPATDPPPSTADSKGRCRKEKKKSNCKIRGDRGALICE